MRVAILKKVKQNVKNKCEEKQGWEFFFRLQGKICLMKAMNEFEFPNLANYITISFFFIIIKVVSSILVVNTNQSILTRKNIRLSFSHRSGKNGSDRYQNCILLTNFDNKFDSVCQTLKVFCQYQFLENFFFL